MSAGEPPAPSQTPPEVWPAWAKLCLRAALCALVIWAIARVLPLSDELTWRADGKAWSIHGEIQGDWKAEAVSFVPEPGSHPLPKLPERDGALLAVRSAPNDGDASGAEQRSATGVGWRPSMSAVFRGLDPRALIAAACCIVASVLLTSTRWWRLLIAAGCPTRWFQALRLTALGFFFNLVVPGLTGGDLVKAVLVARKYPDRRASAVVSVFVDRIIGLTALLSMGVVAALLGGERFAFLRLPLLATLLTAILCACAYFNAALRRRIGVDRLLAKRALGPVGVWLRRIDEAVLLYSKRPLDVAVAVLISFAGHALGVATFLLLGSAFGERVLSPGDYMVIVSIGNTATALPIAPAGWGVGEYVYGSLFDLVGASLALGIAVSVTYRALLSFTSLACGLFLLAPGARREWREASRAARGPASSPR